MQAQEEVWTQTRLMDYLKLIQLEYLHLNHTIFQYMKVKYS